MQCLQNPDGRCWCQTNRAPCTIAGIRLRFIASTITNDAKDGEKELTMIKISVLFFAGAREIVGQNRLEMELPALTSIAELRGILMVRFPRLESLASRAAFAVNEIFALPDTLLAQNDEVAFLPAVSGG